MVRSGEGGKGIELVSLPESLRVGFCKKSVYHELQVFPRAGRAAPRVMVRVCGLDFIARAGARGNKKVSAERIELSTNGLKGHCSAIELRAHFG